MKPTLLALPQQLSQGLCQQSRLQLVGAGHKTWSPCPGCRHLLQRNLLGLGHSPYVYRSHEKWGYLSGFSPVHHSEEMLVSLPWSWICSQFGRGRNSKRECVGMVCFSQHISLSTGAGGKPHQSEELRTRSHHQADPLATRHCHGVAARALALEMAVPCVPPTPCALAGLSGEERKRFAPHPAVTHRAPALPELL